ncbi:hypothetical protein [Nocardia sp. NPDC050793]|uniref:DUF3085 domain-containing protein n=1 Tax=Nocardia sp. NPDC050793 TaxID=3155159 RepID=UPI00340E2B87
MKKPIDLWFPLSQVRVVAEHALAAPEHSQSLVEQFEGTPAQPSLVWVKDDGTYLLSNGCPRQPADPEHPEGPITVVYAHRWGPGTGGRIVSTAVGGDDFAEYLPLHQTVTRGTTLIDAIRSADPEAWMVITVEPDTYRLRITDAQPR